MTWTSTDSPTSTHDRSVERRPPEPDGDGEAVTVVSLAGSADIPRASVTRRRRT
jgi:hypothetical protein